MVAGVDVLLNPVVKRLDGAPVAVAGLNDSNPLNGLDVVDSVVVLVGLFKNEKKFDGVVLGLLVVKIGGF